MVLDDSRARRLSALADSKLLTAVVRERVYEDVVATARAWAAVEIPAGEIDRIGLHVANVAGMRRAVAQLALQPGYVLTDGFAVPGMGADSLAVVKGDRVAACVAAASVVAKVTRDRIMEMLDTRFPEYDFAQHKGYVTAAHAAALARYGPCDEHRRSYANVADAAVVAAGRANSQSLRLEDAVAMTSLRGATESA